MSEQKNKQICAKTRTGDNETTVFVNREAEVVSVRFAIRNNPLVVFTDHVADGFTAAGSYDSLLGGKYRCVTTRDEVA